MARILIVEPGRMLRELAAEALRSRGYQVEAVGAVEAKASIESAPPDLLLFDPSHSDPTILLRALRAASSTTHVLAWADSADRSLVLRLVAFGIRGFILKGTSGLDALTAKITATLLGTAAPARASTPAEAPASSTPAPIGKKAPPVPVAAAQPKSTPVATARPTPLPASPTPPPGVRVAERLKSLLPIMTRSQVQENVDRFSELKAMSPTVAHLVKLTADPAVSIELVVRTIKIDHAMALKMIKLANSSVYTTGQPVSDVKAAVMRIGLNQIRQAVMNIGVVEQCAGPTGFVDTGQFWEHSIACGLIAARLTRARGIKETDGAFTMGLLHDVGRLAYAEVIAEPYARVVAAAASLRLPLEQVEQRMLLHTHGDIMDRILHKWNFPKGLINPIVFHHLSAPDIRAAAPQETAEVATLALANRLASALLLGTSGNPTVYPTEDLAELLNLDPAVMSEIEASVAETTQDLKLAMLSGGSGPAWKPMNATIRARLPDDFRPLFLSASPAIDAYRLFCAALARPAADVPPTVAVVHLRQARETAALSKMLAAELGSFAPAALPLIILSPGAGLALEPAAMNGRPVRALPTPFVIDDFVDAVNALAASGAPTQQVALAA